jgi:glutathione synthase/RimK-type ligase-like ATP-grasp enzyme
MKDIAYLTGGSWRGEALPQGSLPSLEMRDYERLLPAAEAAGLRLRILRWGDARVLDCAGALIRSCWDYIEQHEAFCAALERIEAAGVPLFNGAALVRWNAQKTYLRDLQSAGVPCILTLWADRPDPAFVARAFDTLDCAELVLKPQIGAGSRRTIRLQRNAWSAGDLIGAPEGPVMAQPFLPLIETQGEMSLLYFGGRFSHAVRKIPPPGGWLANDRAANISACVPDAGQLRLAEQVLAAAAHDLLYARVDVVRDAHDAPALIELEAIEPALYLPYGEGGASALCAALAAALAG